jgi:hypothetical protein
MFEDDSPRFINFSLCHCYTAMFSTLKVRKSIKFVLGLSDRIRTGNLKKLNSKNLNLKTKSVLVVRKKKPKLGSLIEGFNLEPSFLT